MPSTQQNSNSANQSRAGRDRALATCQRELRSWALTLAIFLFVITSVGQGYVTPTGSMENTLLIGDHLLVDKLGYPGPYNLLSKMLPERTVERGDVVVFEYPLDPSESYIKRVIGIPGDHIRISAKQLFVNGYAVDEPYKLHATTEIIPYRDDFPGPPPPGLRPRASEMLRFVRNGQLVVPESSYFVMGDNRDYSDDSRFWGLVPRENIRGAPRLIYWSFDAPTPHLLAWFDSEHARNIVTHFHDRTRWKRSLRPVLSHPLRLPGE